MQAKMTARVFHAHGDSHTLNQPRASVAYVSGSQTRKEVIGKSEQNVPLRLLWNWHVISVTWRLRRGSSRA